MKLAARVILTEEEKEILGQASAIMSALCLQCLFQKFNTLHVIGDENATYLVEHLDWCGDILDTLANEDEIEAL